MFQGVRDYKKLGNHCTRVLFQAHSLISSSLREQNPPPETQRHGVKKKKAWPWTCPTDADGPIRREASSRGLIPIGSKSADKGPSSTDIYYPSTAGSWPRPHATEGERKQSDLPHAQK